MKKFPILYSRNSNGKINTWATGVQDDGKVVIWEGILGGTPTRTERQAKAKNVGKMNETTVYEQGCKDAESRLNDKKKKGYKSLEDLGLGLGVKSDDPQLSSLESLIDAALPLTRTDANNLSKPMKAQPYFKDDGTPRIEFPCYGQPKLNGFRVMARWEKLYRDKGTLLEFEIEQVVFRSKEGLAYTILEHIEKDFCREMFFPVINGKQVEIALDGEMYIHGEILSEISSAVRKRNAKTEKIRFCIFDIAVEGIDQKTRFAALNMMNVYLSNGTNISIVPSIVVNDNALAQSFTDDWINNGYEGGIFRDRKAHYQFGSRPKTMVKLKRSQDKEFEIVDVIGGENAPDLGIFMCKAENGKLFAVNPEGTHVVRREYLINKANYIGKKLTVKFFERTKDDLPFHAVGVVIRDYE